VRRRAGPRGYDRIVFAERSLRALSTRAPQLLLVALASVALAGCGSSSTEGTATATAPGGTSGVVLASPEEAQALIDAGGVTVLDVRTPEEFAAGHLAGAENIDFYAADFAERIDALDPGEPYVVYCRSGNRSGQASVLMADKDFASVTDVDGGIVAWETAGLPTVTAG
jgi:rhodanese-related sulfurtransferase